MIKALTLNFGDLFSSFAFCEDNQITSVNENPQASKGSFIFGVSLFFIIVIIIAGTNGGYTATISDIVQDAGIIVSSLEFYQIVD